MKNFKKSELVKKGPGPKLKNSRNYAYSTCYNYNCTTYFSRNINNDVNR